MRNLQVAARLATRALTTSAPRRSASLKDPLGAEAKGVYPASQKYAVVKHLQEEWNATPDMMVWQKRGPRDSILYGLSLVLCLVSVGATFYTMEVMSFPRQKDD